MAVILFVLFWVLLGVGLAYIGLRGGASGARESLHTQTPRARHIAAGVFAIIYVGFGIVIPAVLLVGNHDKASAQFKGVTLTSADRDGRDLFEINCASCHTLSSAHAAGKVGPNLDQLKPPKSLILDALAKGRTRGNNYMPAQILQGEDATKVADFVSKTAGQ
jgi:cytochrome c6